MNFYNQQRSCAAAVTIICILVAKTCQVYVQVRSRKKRSSFDSVALIQRSLNSTNSNSFVFDINKPIHLYSLSLPFVLGERRLRLVLYLFFLMYLCNYAGTCGRTSPLKEHEQNMCYLIRKVGPNYIHLSNDVTIHLAIQKNTEIATKCHLSNDVEDADLLAREQGRGFAASGACGGGRPVTWFSVTLVGRPTRGGSTRGWWLLKGIEKRCLEGG